MVKVDSEQNTDIAYAHKVTVLRSYGFTVGDRDPARNPKFPGRFMVLEACDEEFDEDDWCVVGDDLPALVDEAFDLASDFLHFDKVLENVRNGGDGVLHLD